jgi:hypothetical protein
MEELNLTICRCVIRYDTQIYDNDTALLLVFTHTSVAISKRIATNLYRKTSQTKSIKKQGITLLKY